MRNWWLAAAGWAALAGAAPAQDEARSYVVRGREVRLEPHPNYLAVRTTAGVKAWKADTAARVADAAARAQAAALGRAPAPGAERGGRAVPLARAVLVPRLPGVGAKQLPAVAARMRLEAEEVVPVFRYGGRAGRLDRVPAPGDDPEMLVVPSGVVLARFESAPPVAALAAAEKDLHLQRLPAVAGPQYAPHLYRFARLSGAPDPFTVADALRGRAPLRTRWAQPELVHDVGRCQLPERQAERVPNDPFFERQWHFRPDRGGINMPRAWAVTLGTDRVVVAVVDDGVDTRHEEFRGRLLPGRDVSKEPPDADVAPGVEDAHGTACAGIIGAAGDSGKGTAGAAWNCRILPVKITDGSNFASAERIAAGMAWAYEQGARVFSCSWGGGPPDNSLVDALDKITDGGGLVVAAAGNAGDAVKFPARYEKCLAVGALRPDNTLWRYSCRGPGMVIGLVAPSSNGGAETGIWTIDHGGGYGYNRGGPRTEEPSGDYTGRFGGTSAATPVVAGVAALLWSAHPRLTAAQVRECLQSTAEKVDRPNGNYVDGRSELYGFGKVDPVAALAKAADLDRSRTQRLALRPGMKGMESPRYDPAAAAADLAPKSYSVRGEAVPLAADRDWLVAAGDPEADGAARFRGAVGESAPAPAEVARSGGAALYLVPRSALRPPADLAKAAAAGLPYLSPAYRAADGALVLPTGQVDVRLTGAAARGAATDFARRVGLHAELYAESDDFLTLRLTRESEFSDVFAAAAALGAEPFAKWAQPRLASRLGR